MTTQSRFGAFQILDPDWRRRTWKHWLRSRLAGNPSAPPAVPDIRPPPTAPDPSVERASVAPREADTRRSEVRARFDALFDRLLSLEDSLDALAKRFTLKAQHERRLSQRFAERVESATDSLERQTLSLESITASLERVESRLDRIERSLRPNAVDFAVTPTLESRRAYPRERLSDLPDFSDLSDLEDAFSEYPPTRSTPPDPSDYLHGNMGTGSSIRGSLSEMSLATVLAMLELERRTGVLKVCSDDGSTVAATLRAGAIVGARHQEVEVDPIEAIREALRFESGRFSFKQLGVEVASGPPRSIGSVLLEASSRNDEAARSA